MIRMSKELSDFKIVIMFLFVVRMIQLYIVKMLHFNTLTVWDNWCPWQKILFVSFYLLFKNSLVFLRFGPKNCTSFTQSLRTFIAQTMLTGAFSIFHFHFHKTKATKVHGMKGLSVLALPKDLCMNHQTDEMNKINK